MNEVLHKKQVSSSLFDTQKDLEDYINQYGEEGFCDYTQKKTIVYDLGRVVEKIISKLEEFFAPPQDEYPKYDTSWNLDGSMYHEEGGYVVPNERTIMSTREVFEYAGLIIKSEALLSDIISLISTPEWVIKDSSEAFSVGRLNDNWSNFWDTSIERTKAGISYDKIKKDNSILLKYMTEKIESNLFDLKKNIFRDSVVYRCVNYDKKEAFCLPPSFLWAPPASKATSQRMSKNGQSRMYVSLDKETPIKEAVGCGEGKVHCLAEFSLKKTITILDFKDVPVPNILNVPDFFAYRYFEKFASSITKKINASHKEEYVPTQMMRDVIEEKFKSKGILGIKYRSVKGKNTSNVVFFLDNYECEEYFHLNKYEVVDPNTKEIIRIIE